MSENKIPENYEYAADAAAVARVASAAEAPVAEAPVAASSVIAAHSVPQSRKFGLSGSLTDIQSNTQFVYETPIQLNITPVDAPRSPKLNIFKSFGIVAPVVLLIGAIGGGAVGGAVVAGVLSNSHSSSTVTINNPDSVSWATGAAAKASQSVVTISVIDKSGSGIGSGVILTSDGYILTNTHVVTLEGASTNPSIQVKFSDSRIVKAQLIGTDPTNDLAVIKVVATGLEPATFADSTKLNVGDSVLAIGAPLGLDATVTKGIISTLNRTIDEASSAPNAAASGATIHMSVIQTDAAINPGNSGGALVNSNGEVIGINVAIATAGSSTLGGQSGSIGVGFAIPANIAQRIAKDIMANGKATHGLLGAQISNNSAASEPDAFSNGAKVISLTSGGPGEKAGLKPGDVIVKLNQTDISTGGDLTAAVRQQPAGAEVNLTVIRESKTITITVVLGNADSVK
ncbi:MAG: hypothetical protein RL196_822 [Actinomycetota bacterium]|jgi:putative serine protease PepD